MIEIAIGQKVKLNAEGRESAPAYRRNKIGAVTDVRGGNGRVYAVVVWPSGVTTWTRVELLDVAP